LICNAWKFCAATGRSVRFIIDGWCGVRYLFNQKKPNLQGETEVLLLGSFSSTSGGGGSSAHELLH
jgi:hypothetical protein